MKKSIIALAVMLSSAHGLTAQNGTRTGDFDFSEYPQVSFVWHEYNPEIIPAKDFVLTESEIKLPVTVQTLPVAKADAPKSVVVLWEDMASQGQIMHNFSRAVLNQFFSSAEIGKDEFLVASFNRHGTTEKVMKDITSGFTSSKDAIISAIADYKHSTQSFKEQPLLSDVFPAINEALGVLQQHKTNGTKAIVVLTSGMPLENSATNSVVSVQQLALQYHIPIYVIQYAAGHGASTKMEGLANDTYGLYVSCHSANAQDNINKGYVSLLEFYSAMDTRYAGHDYKITYTTACPRGAETQLFTLNVKGFSYQDTLVSPSHTLISWAKANLILFIVLVIALIVVIVLVVVFVVRSVRKHRASEEEIVRMKNEQVAMATENARKVQEQQDALNNYKAEVVRKQEEARKQEEMERMLTLMRNKNLYPHLQYTENGAPKVYEIHQVETVIGRDIRSANLCIAGNDTVSRRHAVIRFTDNGFVIEDLGSTNGTIVDGVPVKGPVALKSQSLINLGTALINFYL